MHYDHTITHYIEKLLTTYDESTMIIAVSQLSMVSAAQKATQSNQITIYSPLDFMVKELLMALNL